MILYLIFRICKESKEIRSSILSGREAKKCSGKKMYYGQIFKFIEKFIEDRN